MSEVMLDIIFKVFFSASGFRLVSNLCVSQQSESCEVESSFEQIEEQIPFSYLVENHLLFVELTLVCPGNRPLFMLVVDLASV